MWIYDMQVNVHDRPYMWYLHYTFMYMYIHVYMCMHVYVPVFIYTPIQSGWFFLPMMFEMILYYAHLFAI